MKEWLLGATVTAIIYTLGAVFWLIAVGMAQSAAGWEGGPADDWHWAAGLAVLILPALTTVLAVERLASLRG